MTGDSGTNGREQGDVSVDNLICSCKSAGQIMEKKRWGGYVCPNCGQEAEYILRYGDALNDRNQVTGSDQEETDASR